MPTAYYVTVTIHLLAALLWLGGMFFLGAVGAPVLREVEPGLRARLFHLLGIRFRLVGWIALTVLVATGLANLHFRSLLQADLWSSPDFWAGSYGRMLAVKLGCVLLMLVLSAIHDFGVGPAIVRATPGSARAERLRRATSWIGRINALLGVILVIAAVRIAR